MTPEQQRALAAQTLAEMAALKAVKRSLKAQQGWQKLSQITAGVLARMAREHLAANPWLVEQAATDPLVAVMATQRPRRKMRP